MRTQTSPHHAPAQPGVALIGAGAVGLVVAMAFARAGWRVQVCGARNPFAHLRVSEGGLGVEYPVQHARTPAELVGCTVAIVAVKAYQTADVADWIAAFNRPDARILVAQNGLEQCERIAAYAPLAVGLPVVVYFNAERPAPGCSVLRRIGPTDLCLPANRQVHDLSVALQAGGLRVTTAEDMATVVWTKLLANSAANPLTTLCGRHTGVLREPDFVANARQVMTEVARVGQAEGAALTARHVEDTLVWLQNVPPDSTTSMLQDRQAGRPLEYDAITGAIVRAAERHGLDVPLNRLILGLLSAIRPTQA
ncbi:2-dehydropantoate 2-reductase [Acetobacter lambici]|uniref:2-dehydropantoate 2-reductase n=1 Tax=Acetobacter lambici TaxID=1332824 RepID=A0ABT1F1N3_9PROT|nr:2-dehydropantoate 2-reductase [Acetobacter lambici]MCP1241611.1 2-dehydropantoate 2-reductase [Acetobacter lambici]MCP1257669.1 2-dehydropantoate 2-reductase [Acetobacter lambici]NHO56234.1 2-dehydropantoate 2-reductase [Acetobacter lambici]